MKKKVTILLPAYNEEASFTLITQCMSQVIEENPDYDWEFLLVNDGSTDNTLQQMIRLHESDAHYSYLDLSRNYGKEIAMMAGFDYATGDALIIMDADMQHPVSVIPEMLKYWEEGYDDVYAMRQGSKESWLKRKSSHWYYKLLQSLTRVPIQKDTGDFRLLDKQCVQALRTMRETYRYTKGMYAYIGFRKTSIDFVQEERVAGSSKWGFGKLVRLAIDGILSSSIKPLQIATKTGMTVSLISFMYLVYVFVKALLYGDPVRGFPTLIIVILFLGGLQLLSIGILGEYIGRIFHESKHRPSYFIRTHDGKKTN